MLPNLPLGNFVAENCVISRIFSMQNRVVQLFGSWMSLFILKLTLSTWYLFILARAAIAFSILPVGPSHIY